MLDGRYGTWYNQKLRGKTSANFGAPRGGIRLLEELQSGNRVSGAKQSRRALRDGLARAVYLAWDADPALTDPLRALCREREVPVVDRYAMRELGQAAGIQVSAAVVTLLK